MLSKYVAPFYFDSYDEVLPFEWWEDNNQPLMFVLKFNDEFKVYGRKQNVKIWEEVTIGKIMLEIGGVKSLGKDQAVLNGLTAYGDYYCSIII